MDLPQELEDKYGAWLDPQMQYAQISILPSKSASNLFWSDSITNIVHAGTILYILRKLVLKVLETE